VSARATSGGEARIEWAAGNMPVLGELGSALATDRPLAGFTVGACLHITPETAVLLRALAAGGAEVLACAANPLSTQDDVVAALRGDGIGVHGAQGEDIETYYANIDVVLAGLAGHPDTALTVDDGCDLISRLHRFHAEVAPRVAGGTEETTSGVLRLRAMEREGALSYPVVALDEPATKRLLDNRHGTGQSALEGIVRASNVLLAGRKVVVAGYGECGKGIARRAAGEGAAVIVTEVDPFRALEAATDGYAVMPMERAAQEGDVFITATGNCDVVGAEHFSLMKDGAVLANIGHFDVEIDVRALEELAGGARSQVGPSLEEFRIGNRRLLLVAEGRVANLAAAAGHPPAVMDIAFASQVVALQWLIARRGDLEPRVYPLPPELDRDLAAKALRAMDLRIDTLTENQRAYLTSWTAGT
jgi:adenosylhomocysteinase